MFVIRPDVKYDNNKKRSKNILYIIYDQIITSCSCLISGKDNVTNMVITINNNNKLIHL